MHPIPVRTMQFEVPASEDFHPLYIAGNAQLSRVVTTRMRARSMLPWYTPHTYRIPASIEALSAHFTQRAQHVR